MTPEKLAEAVRRLVLVARPEKIILFGSHARGDATRDSDADLLIVETETPNAVAESVRLRRALKGLALPADVVVVSRDKFAYWQDTPGSLYYEASHEGQVLYEAA